MSVHELRMHVHLGDVLLLGDVSVNDTLNGVTQARVLAQLKQGERQ